MRYILLLLVLTLVIGCLVVCLLSEEKILEKYSTEEILVGLPVAAAVLAVLCPIWVPFVLFPRVFE